MEQSGVRGGIWEELPVSCGECGYSRVEDMGRGREMLYCTRWRRFVGATLQKGSGKTALGFGVLPAWCGTGMPRGYEAEVKHNGTGTGAGGASGAGVD